MKKVELEAQRSKTPQEARGGRRRRNPVEDLKREVAIMRTLRHKNIVSLQVNPVMFRTRDCMPSAAVKATYIANHAEIQWIMGAVTQYPWV